MARLTSSRTGVVVNVDDATAAGLDSSEWQPADAGKAEPKKAPAKAPEKKE